MKSASFHIVSLIGIVCLISCSQFKKEESLAVADFKLVKINNEFSLSIPSFMNETKKLNEEASLQYQNIYKEVYVIVIDEDKQKFIETFIDLNEYDSAKTPVENYRKVQLNFLMEGITTTKQTEPAGLKIEALDAQQVQFDGYTQDLKNEISYFLTFIEGNDKMYMIMAWTLKDRKEKYSKMFEAIANTFRPL